MNYFEIMKRHIQNLRNSVANPSKETLAAWHLDDTHRELLQNSEDQEDDDFDFGFTSEVKVK